LIVRWVSSAVTAEDQNSFRRGCKQM